MGNRPAPEAPDLEVIVSSGYSETEMLRLFHGTRLSGFIQKPYTVQELAPEVKTVLARLFAWSDTPTKVGYVVRALACRLDTPVEPPWAARR